MATKSSENISIGDWVMIDNVRSNHLDPENGIGWYAMNVTVQCTRVHDYTFRFQFNGEEHFALKSEVKLTSKPKLSLFGESEKIEYAKDSFNYRMKLQYGI
jgi:hypothetical protein